MNYYDKLFFFISGAMLFSYVLIAMGFIIPACVSESKPCAPIDGTYTRTYTQESASGACRELGNEPQFAESFADGEPLASEGCETSGTALTDDQCHVRLVWRCTDTLDDGRAISATYTEIVSQHEGGDVLEGERSIAFTLDGETCESSGTVHYEARE